MKIQKYLGRIHVMDDQGNPLEDMTAIVMCLAGEIIGEEKKRLFHLHILASMDNPEAPDTLLLGNLEEPDDCIEFRYTHLDGWQHLSVPEIIDNCRDIKKQLEEWIPAYLARHPEEGEVHSI